MSNLFPDYEQLRHEPWWTTMSQLIEASPYPTDTEQTMDLCVTLAVMRARAHQRDMVPLDAVLAASLLCWLPFKPGAEEEGIFLNSAREARPILTQRLRTGEPPVSENSPWIRVSTDAILEGMAQRAVNLPMALFIGLP